MQLSYIGKGIFDNVSSTEKDKPYLYPYDPNDPENQKVTELSSYTGKVIGPAKVLEVKDGETIDISVNYWYTEAPGDPITNVAEIIAGTLLNLGSASAGIIPEGPETGMALLNNVSGSQFGVFEDFISDAFDNEDFGKPKAFIVYMLFDENMELDLTGSGVISVEQANYFGVLSQSTIKPRSDGFFYTYVTNRSEGKVNFDNLTVTRWAPKVRVTYDYYPYGLTWENPTLPSDPNALHDHCYQDKEFQFSEFATGHGLALYDFHARMYDPAIGRWMVPDPAAQFANPYLAMGNNPVIGIDPDGRFVLAAVVVPVIIGMAIGGTIGAIQASRNGADVAGGFIKGAVIGGISASLGQVPIVPAGMGFWNGLAAGAINGGISGGLVSAVQASANNQKIGQSVWKGIKQGALIGSVSGGLSGGIKAVSKKRHFWSGDKIVERKILLDNFTITPQGKNPSCAPSSIKSIDKYFGRPERSIESYYQMTGASADGGLTLHQTTSVLDDLNYNYSEVLVDEHLKESIINSLEEKRPMLVLDFSVADGLSSDGHAYDIMGMTLFKDGSWDVTLMDPSYSSFQPMTHTRLINNMGTDSMNAIYSIWPR